METIFNKIKVQKITEEIAEQLRTLITQGKLPPGEKLPPERSLAEMLGVGRSSLREALNILQAQGFVECRERKGIFICNLGASIVSDPLHIVLEEDRDNLLLLYEIRKDMEMANAARAADARTPSDIEEMNALVDDMASDLDETRLELGKDMAFHMLISRSTGNFFRSHILKSIQDLSDLYLQFVIKHIVNDKAHIRSVLEQHKRIFNAIEKQDPEKARIAMEDHLSFVEDQWKAYVAL